METQVTEMVEKQIELLLKQVGSDLEEVLHQLTPALSELLDSIKTILLILHFELLFEGTALE